MIKLDGTCGEGGGAIVRVALALSTLTRIAFEVDNIRKGRREPGLKAQHLCSVYGAKELCDAELEGAELHSTCLKYIPHTLKGRTLSLDIGTAGSITLALQSMLLPALFSEQKTRIKLTGATDTLWSPPVDYFSNVLLPQLRKFCNNIELKLLRRGYYPKGGGKIDLIVGPKYKLSEFNDFSSFHKHLIENAPKIRLTEQNQLAYIKGISHASSDLQKAEVAERQARAAKTALSVLGNVSIRTEYSETLSTGSGIVLWAVFSKDDEVSTENPVILGSDCLGEKGKRAEIVGVEAAKALLQEINSKAAIDKYLSDQLLPFMALAGKSSIRASEITNHAKTNIYVIEKFLGKCFSVDDTTKTITSN